MKLFRIKNFVNLILVIVLLFFGYTYRNDINRFLTMVLNRLQPCQRPIAYSIGTLDPHFGLTKTQLLNDIAQVEKIWETPIDRQLFQYATDGNLKINLVYDYRQKATDTLKKIGVVLSDDRSTYDALRVKYNSLVATYNQGKTQLNAVAAAYNADKRAYEKDVAYWNDRGGAPRTEYNLLEQRRIELNNQVDTINQARDVSNGLVEDINSAGIILNKLIAALNLQVSNYNTVGASTGKEFNEGEYVSDASGTSINIFQFNDKNQLVRVLAHELGHALGLGHLSNPKAIMYYLNEGVNEKLTADDLVALKKECGIK